MNVLLFLGAGFSSEADLPLQKDFHKKAYSALNEGYFNVAVYWGVSSAYYISRLVEGRADVTLEDAFGILEYIYLTHDDNYKIAFLDDLDDPNTFHPANKGITIREARQNFIGAIEEIFGYNDDQSYKNIGLYKSFFKHLLSNNHKIVIVTTNYDLVCETTLNQLYTHFPAYHVFDPTFEGVPVLKLHGSIDWKETSIDPANMIPPTWMKTFDRHGKYGLIWGCAEEAIISCDMLIFIGYSFPQIDLGVKYLIKNGLQPRKGIKKKEIMVVNPNKGALNRYNTLIRYATVKSIKMIPKYFKDFVQNDLDTIR